MQPYQDDPYQQQRPPWDPIVYPPLPAYQGPIGLPVSDKSKITAGLLQLIPGLVMGLGGIGRLYAGQIGLGVFQLIATVFGWVSFWCGFFLVVPFFVFIGCWLWFVIDGIVLLAGRPVDGQGRPLRG
jgi:TM2 domain-containing membrane protein YozV